MNLSKVINANFAARKEQEQRELKKNLITRYQQGFTDGFLVGFKEAKQQNNLFNEAMTVPEKGDKKSKVIAKTNSAPSKKLSNGVNYKDVPKSFHPVILKNLLAKVSVETWNEWITRS